MKTKLKNKNLTILECLWNGIKTPRTSASPCRGILGMSWGRIFRGKVGLHITGLSTKCLSDRNIWRDHWCISPFFDPREHVFLPTRNKELLQSFKGWLWIFVLLCTQQAVISLCSFTDCICGVKWQKEAFLNFKVDH